MTGVFWFDWPLLALSLANGILLLWLGLTVLLNAERRTPGVALLALAAWLGSAFFAAHTAILASGEGPASAALNRWWIAGWLPLLALPLTWYAVVVWYSNLGAPPGLVRHRLPLAGMAGIGGALAAALFASAGLPSFLDAVNLRFDASAALWGAPWFLVLYPVYILICLLLSFGALLRPAPASTRQGTAARTRARPWLLSANALLVMVAALVAGIMAWVAATPGPAEASELFSRSAPVPAWWTAGGRVQRLALAIAWADLIISALLAAVIFCIGYALVQYEVFSGRSLPRRALRRHWREALLLAAGYGVAVGATLAAGWRPVYSLLLTALLMTIFFALLGWRTLAAQADFMRRLRPFVASPHLVEGLMAPAAGDLRADAAQSPAAESGVAAVDIAATVFTALCRDVLQTDHAVLVATGALAALVAQPLVYPAPAGPPAGAIAAWAPRLPDGAGNASAVAAAVAVADPALPQVAWAVPLHGVQAPTGVLLLGRRGDDGLYTDEEIAIARASGERLLDLLAAAALARRLLTLTREQWAEGQVVDRQARRVLHDEVLPDLHAALILLDRKDEAAVSQAKELLASVHRQTAHLLRSLPLRPPARPTGRLLEDARRLVDEMAGQFDAVRFDAGANAAAAAARLGPLAAEVIFYALRELLRNAARHGHSQAERPLTLAVAAAGGDALTLTVQDDGAGLAAEDEARPGSGQGLALHAAMLAVVGATLEVRPAPGRGVRATIRATLCA